MPEGRGPGQSGPRRLGHDVRGGVETARCALPRGDDARGTPLRVRPRSGMRSGLCGSSDQRAGGPADSFRMGAVEDQHLRCDSVCKCRVDTCGGCRGTRGPRPPASGAGSRPGAGRLDRRHRARVRVTPRSESRGRPGRDCRHSVGRNLARTVAESWPPSLSRDPAALALGPLFGTTTQLAMEPETPRRLDTGIRRIGSEEA